MPPATPGPERTEASGPWSSLTSLLLATALALTGLFVLAVLAGSLPLQVLQVAWQQRFVDLVISHSGFPIVGFLLVHLASHLEADRPELFLLRQRLRRWAVIVTVLYLLLIPLQGYLTVRQFTDRAALLSQQSQTVSDQFVAFAAIIRSAPDPLSLQRQLAAAQGPALSAEDLAKPIAQLRADLLAALQGAETSMPSRIAAAAPLGPLVWQAARDGLRLGGSSLLLAFAYAAGAQGRGARQTLLVRLLAVLRSLLVRRAGRR